MKKTIGFSLFAATCILLAAAFSPNPPMPAKCFNYQAVVRDNDGKPLTNKAVSLKVSFVQDSLGPTTYIEKHTATTNQLGLVNLKIGCGSPLFGSFSALEWGAHDYYIKLDIDLGGGDVLLGEKQVLAVPHALYAEKAGSSGDWVNLGDSVLFSKVKRIGNTPNPRWGLELKGNGDDDFGKIWLEESFPTIRFKNAKNNGNFLWQLDDGGNFYIYDSKYQKYRLVLQSGTGNMGIGTNNPQTTLDVNGSTSTNCLTIKAGCDIIEQTNSTETLLPGEVVVMDTSRPNHVRRCSRAYDRLTIGVVSGAGGITHGMMLSQEGVLDGNVSFAIAGRVKVKVTGAVRPGDLLTTSSIPGRAMVAKDRDKREGAVIGKALSEPDGEGLVLMLVAVQ